MSEEGRSRPLPQRERGATEAGAGPAATPAGPRVLPGDLRQRMQASVKAERAQARERVAEVLRHPPQRRANGAQTSPPAGDVLDGKLGDGGVRTVDPDGAITSGPNLIMPAVNGVAAVNPPLAEPVSPALESAYPAVAVPGLGPGHPSGPSAARSAEPAPAQSAPAEPAWPYPGELRPHYSAGRARRRWTRAGLVVGALAVVAAGSMGAVLALSSSGPPRASGPSGAVVPAQQAAAAAWVARQVSQQTIVSCDQAMCAALVAQGYPPDNLRKFGAASALKNSGVVVVTPAARHLFGSSLVTAWAPAALATFGAGSSAVSVRVVAPHGAATYEQAARRDQAERKTAEAALIQFKRIRVAPAAAGDLRSGRVDGRLAEAIGDAADAQPVDIVGFGNVGAGASAQVPLRYADLAASNPTAGLGVAAYLRSLRAGLSGGPGPSPDRTQLVTLASGRKVLRVEFTAPSPFGVLASP